MKASTMTFTPKVRAFGPKRPCPISAAHDNWSKWCRSKADSPTDLQRFFADNGIHVDWHTCARWLRGDALPGAARIIEIQAAGATGIVDAIFKPAILIGNKEARQAAIQAQKLRLEREARELEELYRLPD